MLVPIPDLLKADQVLKARRIFEESEWVDGRVTAGHQSVRVKNNMQLPENSAAARDLGGMILAALEQNPLFISAALPARVGVPTLVLCGAEDKITPPPLSRELAHLIPGAQLETIAGAGHISNLERPDEFNTLVGAFIRGVDSRAG